VVRGTEFLPCSRNGPSETSGGRSGFGYGEYRSWDLDDSAAPLSDSAAPSSSFSLTSGYLEYARLAFPNTLCVMKVARTPPQQCILITRSKVSSVL